MNTRNSISSCLNDIKTSTLPMRATYMNVYKWPESDTEFMKSMTSKIHNKGTHKEMNSPKVVDSISCRQIYLKSYRFSKKETVQEKTKKCFGKVKGRVRVVHNFHDQRRKMKKVKVNNGGIRRKYFAALFSLFHRLLTCTASVDVVDTKG